MSAERFSGFHLFARQNMTVSTTTPTPTPTPMTTTKSPSPVMSSTLVSISGSKPPSISGSAASGTAASSTAAFFVGPSEEASSAATSGSVMATSKVIPESSKSTLTAAVKPSPSSQGTPTTATPVPKPSFVPVIIATIPASTTSSSTHSPVSKWSSSGNLMQGYCATPEYTILDGPTVYWAPVVGCVGGKSDCCPFSVPASTVAPTAAGTVPATITITILASAEASQQAVGASGGFPIAVDPAQATLDRCPDDYQSVGDGCCPSNYLLWNTAFGGQTPCYSTLLNPLTPPPIPDSIISAIASSATSQKPISAIVNVVYAIKYPVKPPPKAGLATSAKIGIGAGAGGAALLFGLLISLLIWRHRVHKRDREALESLSGSGPGLSSARHSTVTAAATARSRYSIPSKEVAEWRQDVLPEVAPQPVRQYPVDWTPSPGSGSPPPLGGRNDFVQQQQLLQQQAGLEPRFPSPPIPGPYPSQVELQGRPFPMVSPTELQAGQDFQRQELQGQQWAPRYEAPSQ